MKSRILTLCGLFLAALTVLATELHAAGGGTLLAMAIIGSRKIDAPELPSGSISAAVSRAKPLPRENLVHALMLRFSATFAVTGGTAAGSIFSDATFRWFKRVLIETSKRKLWSVSGQAIAILNEFLQPQVETQDPPSNDTAGLSETVEANLYLPFHMPHAFAPMITALPLYALDNPTIRVEMNDPGAAVTAAGDGAYAFSGAQLELYEHPIENLPMHPARELYGLQLINDQEYVVAGSETSHKFYLENIEPGEEIARIVVEAFSGGTNGTDYAYADDVVDELLLVVNGQDKFKTTGWTVQQDRNKRVYQLAARKTGVVMIDAAEDKNVGDLWRVQDGGKPYLQAKLTKQAGDCMVRVTTVTVLRAARKAA